MVLYFCLPPRGTAYLPIPAALHTCVTYFRFCCPHDTEMTFYSVPKALNTPAELLAIATAPLPLEPQLRTSMAWIMYLLSLLGLGSWLYFRARRQRYNLPPGPPRDPILGNLRIMPTEQAPFVFHEWSKKYGTAQRVVTF